MQVVSFTAKLDLDQISDRRGPKKCLIPFKISVCHDVSAIGHFILSSMSHKLSQFTINVLVSTSNRTILPRVT